MPDPISRRAFFGQAAVAPAAGLLHPVVEKPKSAWIIVMLNWEYNDENSYQQGEMPLDRLFYDKEEADRECQRLCDEFFGREPTEEFSPEVENYMWGTPEYARPDFDPADVTWDQLRENGFPDPYYVMEITNRNSQTEENAV
jgi:hypothetical protein